jgi:hypothetical protein
VTDLCWILTHHHEDNQTDEEVRKNSKSPDNKESTLQTETEKEKHEDTTSKLTEEKSQETK